ncbi:hypothetical protein BJ322DRAFT_425458 [Thelephora terrestris]|uniref:AAA+ ATPase domain-containing protein n=1 Tax=Thelephora terrestris TaxID=56493 RepID=A0A9P6HPT5_9AGAM|nr:hypothetical protein BJ322DRAFT_425458 [Thelephora terrestris]
MRSSTMASKSQRQKGHDGVPSRLDVAIQLLSGAKDACGAAPAQIVLGSAYVLLAAIKDNVGNKQAFIDLGLFCAKVCGALNRGLNGEKPHELNESAHEAIGKLRETLAEIQSKVTKKGKQNWASRFLTAKGDKDAIASWKRDLVMVLHVFNTELAIGSSVAPGDIYDELDELANGEGARRQCLLTQARSAMTNAMATTFVCFQGIPLGELPPPAPKALLGRNDLIEEIVGRAEKLESIALIGAGGIGKTAIALAVLHDDRIKRRFGGNRRFIRCDEFLASRANFLAQLSKVVGSCIKNPEDLTQLRPLLSSKAMILFLDNAESILDPRGTEAQEIYTVVEELSQFSNICLGITSRFSTVPPLCKRLEIPTLSMEAACDIFYSTSGEEKRSTIIDDLLQSLDFHTLSIKLLATATSHNMWDPDRLSREWGARHAQGLRTDGYKSLATTIELSLASPTFQNLGSDAREILGVVAFFPQGIDENNLNWLFPTISNRRDIFDTFCILALTSRTNGFITMLAPIREYLLPKNPKSSPLLCAARDGYFTRLSVDVHPEKPGFGEARWIVSEDVNVEHLLNVFISIDPDWDEVWDACFRFIQHLVWLKPRKIVLGPKVEGLPDNHHSKPRCLFELSQLFERLGNWAEAKQLSNHTLELERRRGDHSRAAETLRFLCNANRMLGHREEGIRRGKEAIEIHKRLYDTIGQADCWNYLGMALFENGQLDAAEDAASRALNLVSEKSQGSLVCKSHQLFGFVYDSKGEREKAIHHLETSLKIASAFDRHDYLFWIHWSLVEVFCNQGRLDDANTHAEQLKLRAADNLYHLGCAMKMRAIIWYQQRRFEEAKSEALCALEILDNLGAAMQVTSCRSDLQLIELAMESDSTKVQCLWTPIKCLKGFFSRR